MSCNCKKTNCGCVEPTLTSPVTTVCNNTEPCEEITGFECVKYNGNDIYSLGINNGDRLDVVIKKLALYLTDPLCYNTAASCQSIKDFSVVDIASTTASVFWSYPPAPAAVSSVKLEYSTDPTFATSTIVSLTSTYTSYNIINLTANTTYYVRFVSSTVSSPDCCESIVLSFKTLP